MSALGVRVGGDAAGSDQAHALAVLLPHRRGEAGRDDTVPALIITGHRPGPRVAIVAGARGFEVNAARLVSELEAWLSPAEVTGTVVLVPVLRPGGRFAAGGRPVKPALVWHFPGDPTGSRAARDAFAAFTAIVSNSALMLTVAEADPGRVSATAIKGDVDDPRVRRLMRASGATALLPVKRRVSPTTLPDGVAADAIHLELAIPARTATRDGGGVEDASDEGERTAFGAARAVLRRLLYQVGVWTPERAPAPAPRPLVCRHVTAILAPAGGFLEALAQPGIFVAKGEPLARISPPLGRTAVIVPAPQAGVVLEAPDRAATRRGAKLFVLGRTARTNGERPSSAVASRAPARPTPRPIEGTEPKPGTGPLYLGWVERVSLPDLGIETLAKIDTGARTSALHVTRMRAITGLRGLEDGPRRPVLELTIPRNDKRPRADRVVRVRVRDFVQIKDSSGRTERRPVIETTLRLGAVKRKVRVTLTDRGDMTYPMLIGRTALGAGVLIDPARRRLLDPPRGKPPQRKA